MRKDSVFIFGMSVLITAGIVGGVYYMNIVRPIEQADSWPRQMQTPNARPATGNVASPAYSQNERTDRIIKCVDPQRGEFWTNAKNCESADLDNRISNAQTFRSTDYISPSSKEIRKDLRTSSSINPRAKPDLRQVAKAVPKGLGVSCRFAVGRALEIERMLSASDDPAESTWRENYCKWINETHEEGCDLPAGVFYYGAICPHI
jgi:hypothetical protein